LDRKQSRLTWDKPSLGRAIAHYEKQWKKASASTRPAELTYEDLFSTQWLNWLGDVGKKQKPTGTMTVLLGRGPGAMQIDVKQRTVTELVGPAVPNPVESSAFSAGNATELFVLPFKLKNVQYQTRTLERPTGKAPYYVISLEARWPIERKATTLLNRIQVDAPLMYAKVSPNGLFAILKYAEPRDEKNKKRLRIHYVIVDNAGNLVDNLFFEHLVTDEIGIVMPWLPKNLPNKPK
jgi:hypothetical protein